MICRPPINPERPTLEIRDISHEVLECVPQAANLERIRMVLRESAWGGLGSDLEKKSKKRKRGDVRKWTRAQLESVVQASEGELERGLRERNVVEIDGTYLHHSEADDRSNVITTRK
jgi:sister chromatid cohesion protein DCC1